MEGKRTYVTEEVSPGDTYEMYVDMQTPSEPGEYAGFWQLFSGAGIPFGETLWVAIEVTTSSGATATPDACVIHSLTATPSELKVGGNLIVEWSWTCDSVAKSRLSRTDPDGTVVPLLGGGDVPNPGTYDDIAAKVGTMTYYLKVDSEFGASAEQSVSVIVTE